MNWPLSLLVAVLTGIVGLFAAGFLANLNVGWYRISSFEGGSGYYVVFIGLLGGVVGCIVGLIAARIVAGWPGAGFLLGLGVATGTMLALVLVIGVFCRLAADVPPTIDGKDLELAVEVRAPRGFTPDFPREPGYSPFLYLNSTSGAMKAAVEIKDEHATQVEGRLVYVLTLSLNTSASTKTIRAYFNKTNDAFFVLPLRAHPKSEDMQWSRWIASAQPMGQPTVGDDATFSLRYRVVIPQPATPAQAEAESEPDEVDAEQAAFAAMPPNAPLAAWLPYTNYGTPEVRVRAALHAIQAMPNLARDLEPIVTGADHECAAIGLRMISQLETVAPDLNEVVSAAGRTLIGLIREFNAQSVEQDPSMQLAADISVRFSAWMQAVRTMRDRAGGDFTGELGEILTLSRVREDSHCMQMDVRRVASYYMKEWAALEPLPGDPKPR